MRTLTRRIDLAAPPDAAFAACLGLLRSPDRRRGVVERRCEPDPPVAGGIVVSTVEGGREVRSRIAVLDRAARQVTTEALGEGPSLRVALEVRAAGAGSRVTLTSEVTAGLTGRARSARLLDGLIYGRVQRRSARATLRRLRELAAG